MREKFDFSLILACYNESSVFAQSAKKIFEVLDQTDLSYEVIFIDDASSDKTPFLIKKFIKKNPRRHLQAFYHQKNQGRGATVAEGILKARGKVVGFIDIDLEIPADDMPRFINAILSGFDLATSYRIYDFSSKTLIWWLVSKGYRSLRSWLLANNLKDTEAGYKFFNRQKILPILKKTKDQGWFWDTEIMVKSQSARLKIIEIPTVFIKNPKKKTTVKLIHDSFNYLWKLIKYSQTLP